MSLVTRETLQTRIRRLFLEEATDGSSTDFIDRTGSPNEMDEAYDQACQEQHAIVMDNAEKTGRLEDHDHPYLQRYLRVQEYTIARGTSDYVPVSPECLRAVKLEVDGMRAVRKSPAEDRIIRSWPDAYGPAKGEAFWSMLSEGIRSPVVAGDKTRFLRVYLYGDRIGTRVGVPLAQASAAFTFYRLTRPMRSQSPLATYSDIEDPYNEGPVHGAVARLQEKAQMRERASFNRLVATDLANKIIPPPPTGSAA